MINELEINGVVYDIQDKNIDDAVRTIDTNKVNKWDNKSDFSGNYEDLSNKPTIPIMPTKVSELENDSKFITDATNTLENYYTIEEIDTHTEHIISANDDILNALPSEIATGTDITISDAKECRLINTSIKGKCEQETRSGKNLFNSSLYSNTTINGITLTKNDDGTITLNGTATAQADFNVIDLFSIDADDNTTASITKLSGSVINDGTSNTSVEWNISDISWGNRIYTNLDNFDYDSSIGAKMTSGIAYTRCTLRVQSGVTCTNLILGLQIEQGDITDFEQYGASPSPDYPSEIKTVKGVRNLLEPIMATTTSNGVTCTNNEDGTFTLNGTATANVNFKLDQSTYNNSDNLKTYNGNYTLSCEELITGVDFWLTQMDTFVSPLNLNVNNKSMSANIDNMDGMFMYVRVVSGTTLNNLVIRPMLEEGDTPHKWVPYGNWLNVVTIGKNLLNNTGKSQTLDGVIFTKNNDGTITVGGTFRSTQFFVINEALKLEPNTTYILSGAESASLRLRLREYDSDNTNLSEYWDTGSGLTFTTKSNMSFVHVQLVIYAQKDNVLIKPMISKEGAEYEPYKENIALIDMNKENLKDNNPIIINAYMGSNNITANDSHRMVYVPCKPSTTYTVTKVSSARFGVGTGVEIKEGNGVLTNETDNYDGGTKLRITSGENDNYIAVWYYNATVDTLTEEEILDSIQIYEGREFNGYYELCSIEDIKDELVISNDKVKIIQRIRKIVLDGSEAWAIQGSGTENWYYFINISAQLIEDSCISSHYQKSQIYTSNTNEGIYNTINSIRIRYGIEKTLDEWESFLKEQYDNGTPLTVYYALAEPIEINLGYITDLPRTFDGTNHISVESNVDDVELDIEYVQDLKTYINNLINSQTLE